MVGVLVMSINVANFAKNEQKRVENNPQHNLFHCKAIRSNKTLGKKAISYQNPLLSCPLFLLQNL